MKRIVEEPDSRTLACGWWIVDPAFAPMRGPYGEVLIRQTQTPAFWRAWYRLGHVLRRAYYMAAWFSIRQIAKRKGFARENFFNMTLAGAWRLICAGQRVL
jgi:hypothetical protein